jgi:hypothetical protein
MRVVLNRIFLGVTLLVTLAAHYEYQMAWKEALAAGAGVALVYYLTWEVRRIRRLTEQESSAEN